MYVKLYRLLPSQAIHPYIYTHHTPYTPPYPYISIYQFSHSLTHLKVLVRLLSQAVLLDLFSHTQPYNSHPSIIIMSYLLFRYPISPTIPSIHVNYILGKSHTINHRIIHIHITIIYPKKNVGPVTRICNRN